MADRELVHQAEQHILGTCMAHGVVALEAVTEYPIRSASFATLPHELVYAAMVAMWAADEPIDPVSVGARMQAAGDLKRAGGLPYLHELDARALPPVSIGPHLRIVVEAAFLRDTTVDLTRVKQAVDAGDAGKVAELRAQLIDTWTAQPGAGYDADSWRPVDLGPYLRGEVTRPSPAVGVVRNDGLQLLYAGKEHAVIGEMESGKSWFALACVAAELLAGRHVVYIHFEESDPTDTIERLLALAVDAYTAAKLFRFVGPDRPVAGRALARLLDPVPSLVVLDGVNEAMSMHALAIREEDGAAAFRRLLVKPCTAVGAAVLAGDHVVKDREGRGRYALGSIHKGNGLTGAQILLENADPFGRGMRGRSHVYVVKDRPGHLRSRGRTTKLPGKAFMGELVVDDSQTQYPELELGFYAPAPEGTDAPTDVTDSDAAAVLAAVRRINGGGKAATVRAVRATAGLGKDKVETALARLVVDDVLIETSGPRNSRVFTVAEDQIPGVVP